jgi:hypothetical protein
MHLENRFLSEDEIERALDCFLLGLCAQQLLSPVDFGLIEFEVLVLGHPPALGAPANHRKAHTGAAANPAVESLP